MTVYKKDPDAVLDYQVNWTDWLNGDTIATSLWEVSTGITVDADSKSTAVATVWLSGGTEGQSYKATNRITTVAGRTEDQTLLIQCKSN